MPNNVKVSCKWVQISQIGLAPKERMIKILLSKSYVKEGAHINKLLPHMYFITWNWTKKDNFARVLLHLICQPCTWFWLVENKALNYLSRGSWFLWFNFIMHEGTISFLG